MRTIWFRGKRKDNGKWVIGYLVEMWSKYGEPQKFAIDTCTEYDNQGCSLSVYEVIPETVGQFTGLKDKNGREIYEGDVVKDEVGIGRIDWDREDAAWVTFKNDYPTLFSRYYATTCEVIGNIYDNQELLK